ncbi:phosphate ABC transporter substrate-binding protein [Alcanivorax sp. HI0033]|jgi:phosphate transport system substrate-binding protein|uniref:substrate-binding domain-containing protein n=1 Tax=unclassified Alcanivorax TaxID=2638842 RepID=UPI000789D2B2|nr:MULTISPECIES: substrate-binding domain-containing protein [unclassified Alcanivorax]KZX73275.1 phosphate ABC transporter substrate-binding protein [Alcanivorax sp. HI0011]KZX86818.1 phosphate ABC transporter substrate-binding protein [Alcanivorax sp. HI0013]KZY19658.1 phosphate ABC transporter substrate-binding protein [Alcanivorax sp. HI0035]MEE3387734.1 substrate-binding domain-containing protein [Pseudomonadota bacterium]KZX62110.1 phosphate ABC transporter substrate-binding protein [Alc
MKATLAGAAAALAMASVPGTAMARDTISIVGSSTVYPFATVVAERFGRTGNATPKIESTGSGGGMKLFCQGVGTQHPDITNASRRMKKSEFELCQSNGVKDITEVKVGYDGIVIANSVKGEQIDLSLRDIFLALAKDVPNPDGSEELVANPYKTWKEVNPALPNTKIEVLGPPPTSGTRDAFNELAIEGGCKTFPWLKAIKDEDKSKYKAICRSVREDGAYVEAGENDNLIVQKLEKNPAAYGVFGYSFLDQNRGVVQAANVDGVEPTFDAIGSGDYPVSRSLFFYVKKAHVGVVPGIEGYVKEFTSEKAWGNNGYLSEKGLIPLGDDLRKSMAKQARSLKSMTGEEL